MRHDLTLARKLDAVSPAAQAVTALLPHWEPEGRDAVDLALVEALTNIIRHGPQGETQPIRVEVEVTPSRVTVDIVDTAPPLPANLLERAGVQGFDFDPEDIGEIPESGRGVALILVLMDEVTLLDKDGLSRLRLMRRR